MVCSGLAAVRSRRTGLEVEYWRPASAAGRFKPWSLEVAQGDARHERAQQVVQETGEQLAELRREFGRPTSGTRLPEAPPSPAGGPVGSPPVGGVERRQGLTGAGAEAAREHSHSATGQRTFESGAQLVGVRQQRGFGVGSKQLEVDAGLSSAGPTEAEDRLQRAMTTRQAEAEDLRRTIRDEEVELRRELSRLKQQQVSATAERARLDAERQLQQEQARQQQHVAEAARAQHDVTDRSRTEQTACAPHPTVLLCQSVVHHMRTHGCPMSARPKRPAPPHPHTHSLHPPPTGLGFPLMPHGGMVLP